MRLGQDIAGARADLYRTGVFRRIRVTTEEGGESDADAHESDVTFELQENPRFQVSYGGRYESDVGVSVLVDGVNTNSLGRGHLTGFWDFELVRFR